MIKIILHMLMVKLGIREPIKIVLMGDSIARRTQASGLWFNDSLADVLEDEGIKVVLNTGHGGHTTAQINKQLQHIRKSKADIVIITGGINDILQGVPLDETIKNMQRADRELHKAGKRVLRLLPHKCKWDKEGERLEIIDAVDGIVPDTTRYDLIDNYHFNTKGKKKVARQIRKAL